eukprot:COSAG02_NODE_39_length_48074_cov_106.508890_26_plen_85_part_00
MYVRPLAGAARARGYAARAAARTRVPVKTPMTEGGTKHSAQIKIDLFLQMRAGWRGSWGKMGGQAMKAGEIAPAGPHTCYWGGS